MARKLEAYRKKRRFDRTPEPKGAAGRRAKAAELHFVVQKHAARRLHYDFRLELDGVLLSWAVPRGPSLSPSERRLAVRTEDHPLDYADFEGVIPEGEYGGGTVLVWDRGTWTPEGDAREQLLEGRLTFTLHGDKLRGRWHLVRTRLAGGKENWLLFKGRDAAASDEEDALSEESVLSGRELDEVREAPERVWHSDREPNPKRARPAKKRAVPKSADVVALVRQLPLDFPLTNLDKVLYPEQGIRKADLIAYYAAVSAAILPHVVGRPLTLVRCPDGHEKQCFFQKHAKDTPDAIDRVPIREESGAESTYMAIHDAAGLYATAQLGALELHTWGCHVDAVEKPDQLVFDVDPDVGLHFSHVIVAARELKERLAALGLESFVKTTGGKGLHVVAPVARRHDWETHKAFARGVVEQMRADAPAKYTLNARKAERKGRIFLDYLRNGRGATAVAAFSPRARAGAPVATPISWGELGRSLDPAAFTVFSVVARLSRQREDPWAAYEECARQPLTRAAQKKVGLA
jgi:bifunctional non-homologous end joining protein LigD